MKLKVFLIILAVTGISIAVPLIWYGNTHIGSAAAARELGQKAAKKGDVSLCDNLKISYLDITNNLQTHKLICAKEVAVGLQDPAACEIVPDNWKYFCYRDVAFALNDQSICDNIDGTEIVTQKTCYGYFAINQNDISICNKVENIEWRGYCIKEVQDLPINNIP